MLVVLLLHVALAALAGRLARTVGPRAFLVAALAPLAGVVLAVAAAPTVLDGGAWETTVPWVPGMDLSLALRLDALSLLMLVLVSGVGLLIFTYCAWYAERGPQLVRFVATLTGFAGAMFGLVLADDVILLYVFWELTTVTSYLLVGLSDEDAASRRSAMQALLVTTLGGLTMLVGLILLSQAAGTTRISEIVADPPSGATVPAALVLVLVGAFSKSAQVPFHPWLPAAMAAPTPVSAYLHAAAMVKAGIYLVARLSPVAADVEWWRPVVAVVGVATMLVGGWRALRQHDLKRLLAFSTVSQLGFLTAVAGWGTHESAVATGTLLLAHGFAKAALFLTLGAVDHQAHSRDLRELTGLARRMPVLAGAAGVAALSMGGVPLLLGFIAKEEVYAAVLYEDGAFPLLVVAGLAVGSALTLGYALRFWWGAFGTKDLPAGDPDALPRGARPVGADVPAPSAGLVVPVAALALLSVVLGVAPQLVDPLVAQVSAPYLEDPADASEGAGLALWHGVNTALLLSLTALAAGVAVFLARRAVTRAQDAVGRWLPAALDADLGYRRAVDGVETTADAVTGRTQTGSLPVYLGVISATAAALPASALLLRGADVSGLRLYDVPAQAGIAILVAVAAVGAAFTRSRLPAVLLVGAVGYGVALLYVLQGGADLALTQFLVETLSVVIFLLVLRLLPKRFAPTPRRRPQVLRALVAVAAGAVVTVFTLVAASARTRPSVAEELVARSYPEGHGKNVVNVILVDFRGLDTLGEVTVVLTAALGIAALVLTVRAPRPTAPAEDHADGTEDRGQDRVQDRADEPVPTRGRSQDGRSS
ncbi:hydrogen gas-evolving membrane-bound hydrogenase subunit E [Thalassiella azotivora]